MKLIRKNFLITSVFLLVFIFSRFVFAAGDVTPPSITGLSPEDNGSTNCGTVLTITFDENIAIGTGNITIYKSFDDFVFEIIDVSGGSLFLATAVEIEHNNFITNTDYYVQIDAGAFEDTSANPFAGISDNTTWNFTAGDCDSPIISQLSPADNSTSVELDSNLVITFNEGVGNPDDFVIAAMHLYRKSDDELIETFEEGNAPGISGLGTDTITINPTNDFEYDTEYYVSIEVGFFEDGNGNNFAGISDTTTWNFTTVSAPTPPSGGGGGGSPSYACSDDLDNEGDGLVDYPEDPGCEDAKDRNEYNDPIVVIVYSCSDGIDNDTDGLIDFPNDLGCQNPEDTSEENIIIPPPIDPIEPPIETCATNPSLCPPPSSVETCVTNPSLCPPAENPCVLDPLSCAGNEVIEESIFEEEPILSIDTEQEVSENNCENPTKISFVVWCSVVDSYNFTLDKIKVSLEQVNFIVVSPGGNFIVKAIGIVGIIFGAIFSVLPRLFANPFSFTEIAMLPYRLWSAILSVFGLKKRVRPWGTVYDSVTKQPLDPVIVSLLDLSGNEIDSSVTDMDGRYGFFVGPGKYRISLKKTHYDFPSLKLVGETRDELYLDLYFGDVFEISSDGEVITKNVPMDPVSFDWNEFAKRDQKLMKFYSKRDLILTKLSDLFFSFGFFVAFLAFVSVMNFYNIFIFAMYVGLLFLKETGLKIKNLGFVLDTNGNPLSFSILKIFEANTNTLIAKKVANKYGQYYCLVQKGEYFVEIDRKMPDESYQAVFQSEKINAQNGIIKETFVI